VSELAHGPGPQPLGGESLRSRLAGVATPVVAGLALVNVVVAYALATSRWTLAIAIALLPALALGASAVLRKPGVLLFGALALTIFGGPLNNALPFGGGAALYPADLIVGLALISWLIRAATHKVDARRPFSLPALGIPFVVLAVALSVGVLRGHERYGLSYVSQPVRIFAYALIAAAIIDVTPRQLYRGLVAVFYVGAVWHAGAAVYYLATGRSQTESVDLSTGGSRVLALSTAMLLACSLVLALLNLELDTDRSAGRNALHLVISGLATFGIVVSLGRTTFAAVAVLIPLLLLALRRMRRALLSFIPLSVPFLVLLVVVTLQLVPNLWPTLQSRVTGKLGNDSAVETRTRKFDATLQGFDQSPILGMGFGRPVTYVAIDRSVQTFSGDPENSYVYLLAGGGILTLGAWIAFALAFVWSSLRRLTHVTGSDRVLVLWSLGTWFVFSINALTGPILSVPSFLLVLWIAMLIPGIVSHRQDHEPASAQVAAPAP
jgi:O-antigen ligase